MRGTRKKWIVKLASSKNPVLLTLIRNKYGERTTEMGSRQIYKAAKEMWNRKELQRVEGWPPTLKDLKNI